MVVGGSCDIKDYRTVVIGDQTWMAENLNCDVSGSKCYNNNPDYCNTYGRLYDWATAMAVCPSGWHLPSDAEWSQLIDYVENDNGCSSCAGKYLKATSGWNDGLNGVGNGKDTYGFSALPGGYSWYSFGNFNHAGYCGWWWRLEGGNKYYICGGEDINSIYSGGDEDFYSVRCVQD
jgi:uncharacterized protein (TIGR02145 family)